LTSFLEQEGSQVRDQPRLKDLYGRSYEIEGEREGEGDGGRDRNLRGG
jgi:hypothetical protein